MIKKIKLAWFILTKPLDTWIFIRISKKEQELLIEGDHVVVTMRYFGVDPKVINIISECFEGK